MSKIEATVLVVDDDPDVRVAARLLLKRHFDKVLTAGGPDELAQAVAAGEVDVVLLDMNFSLGANSGEEGLSLLEQILADDPETVVVLMTAYGDLHTAVNAIKLGATDFVLKPWQNEKLVATLTAAARLRASRSEVGRLKVRQRELTGKTGTGPQLIGESPAMRELLQLVDRVAPTDANVLLLGENGTGKERLAEHIHRRSQRADEVFLPVDLGAVAETLFESELFGHRKGAFTDAREDRAGRFQAASGGTLLLDEIGNLPLHLQAKLLSVLEQRQVVPVGAERAVPVDVRLICATNKRLDRMVADGTFREDLLYRINTVEIRIPPLRERVEDIPILLDHYIRYYSRRYELTPRQLSEAALRRLRDYPWPGNVRELRHAVERALIVSESRVLGPDDFLLGASATRPHASADDDPGYRLEDVEKSAIRRALTDHEGNISQAAQALGITRAALYRRLKKHGL